MWTVDYAKNDNKLTHFIQNQIFQQARNYLRMSQHTKMRVPYLYRQRKK